MPLKQHKVHGASYRESRSYYGKPESTSCGPVSQCLHFSISALMLPICITIKDCCCRDLQDTHSQHNTNRDLDSAWHLQLPENENRQNGTRPIGDDADCGDQVTDVYLCIDTVAMTTFNRLVPGIGHRHAVCKNDYVGNDGRKYRGGYNSPKEVFDLEVRGYPYEGNTCSEVSWLAHLSVKRSRVELSSTE